MYFDTHPDLPGYVFVQINRQERNWLQVQRNWDTIPDHRLFHWITSYYIVIPDHVWDNFCRVMANVEGVVIVPDHLEWINNNRGNWEHLIPPKPKKSANMARFISLVAKLSGKDKELVRKVCH